MDPRVAEVLEVWFGKGAEPTPAIVQRWFVRDPEFDAELRRRLGDLHAEAVAGKLDGWRGDARSELALIVLLDQLSRNLHRDDPAAFACDAAALTLARDLRRNGGARRLTFHQQMVALLPFQHAEDPSAQAEAVAAYTALVDEARARGAGEVAIAVFENALDYANQHAAIIARFGRFPHRNRVLGRTSTPEEHAFLEQPGSSF